MVLYTVVSTAKDLSIFYHLTTLVFLYPKDKKIFTFLADKGLALCRIHLLKGDDFTQMPLLLRHEDGSVALQSHEITQYRPRKAGDKDSEWEGKIWINETQYFVRVPQKVWHMYTGGYQPAQKWLKDRKGTALTKANIIHYAKIIRALKQTAQLSQEIDTHISLKDFEHS